MTLVRPRPYDQQMDPAAVVRSAAALSDQNEDTLTGFMLASIYLLALYRDQTPRSICDDLFIALPDDEVWPTFARALDHAVRGGGS